MLTIGDKVSGVVRVLFKNLWHNCELRVIERFIKERIPIKGVLYRIGHDQNK